MRIVFMGTPDYAAVTLQKLIDEKYDIVAVFAQPDKPVGRKRIITPVPVKVTAQKYDIPVFQPVTLRDGKAKSILEEIKPDVIVVVAYGKILPKEILNIAKFGCVNAHASLLPKYRGASPIQWAIVCGETVTGISTMFMDEGMDTGDILETIEVKIGEEETAEQLFDRLAIISAQITVSTLEKIEKGEINPKKQDEAKASYAPIIKKEMALLDFKNKTAKEICNMVRGFYSWPCAYFFLDNKRIKVIKAKEVDFKNNKASCILKSSDEFIISCKDSTAVSLLEISPEGSKQMNAKQFLCGKKILVDTVIGEDND